MDLPVLFVLLFTRVIEHLVLDEALLEEVIGEGNSSQQDEARKLLSSLS